MQATNNILLIRPSSFAFNAGTAISNTFQIKLNESEEEIKQKKLAEFELFVQTLTANGVNVFVVDDTVLPEKPDAIFPNNWVSFHADGTVILYPMCAVNRQHERRQDIIDLLKKSFIVNNIIDLSKYESEHKYLEGTGSIIFDHIHKIAYACLSPRTDKALFIEVCTLLNYRPIYFYAYDNNGQEIYHTNVMMCIAEKFSAICLDSITNQAEKELVVQSLTQTGHQIVDISFEQMSNFAGNMLELKNKNNQSLLALSQSALQQFNYNTKNRNRKIHRVGSTYN
jgi:hypothetical protein